MNKGFPSPNQPYFANNLDLNSKNLQPKPFYKNPQQNISYNQLTSGQRINKQNISSQNPQKFPNPPNTKPQIPSDYDIRQDGIDSLCNYFTCMSRFKRRTKRTIAYIILFFMLICVIILVILIAFSGKKQKY